MNRPIILDGRTLRDQGVVQLKKAIADKGKKPTLAIVQVGDLSESNAYIEQKRKFAEKIGAGFLRERFPEDVAEAVLTSAILKLNASPSVHGIIVQLPIPARLDKQKVIDAILPTKDVDGLTSTNKKLFEEDLPAPRSSRLRTPRGQAWQVGDKRAVPATARGVLSLLSGYGIAVSGKKATVIGRSVLVGAPIAALLKREGATVTVCHRGTPDIPAKSRSADILVVAIGRPHFITSEYVSPGQVVVDVGINSVEGEKLEDEIPRRELVGDVDFESVKNIIAAISPVPGGVGPMTVLSLFENLLDAYEQVRNR